jgi:hypothetical protein
MNNNFKLIAKILKQYEPNSEDRIIAGMAIANYNARYTGKTLTLKLQSLLEETV